MCADVASFELERRGGGGGARRDGGDERVASLAAHRAKEIDAWRAAATLPGGGDRGNEKKFEVSGLNKSKSSPDVAWYLRALRLRAAECALAGDRDGALAASDAVVATLTDVLGEGHPERGVAMLEAAEVAAAAAAGAADAAGIKKSSGSSGGERNVAAKNADAYALSLIHI